MEKAWPVEFRNVGCSYFSQSRVECHYSLSEQHTWTSNDWIGLFKVGWSSLRDYHTFVWAVAPANYQEGTDVNSCVHFYASYLPKPSSQEYQFVYVSGKGEVCSCSPKFTFCAPKPLEDLVTLEEGTHGDDGGTDMLVVVPRAELLQSRLQECLRERAALLQSREEADRQREWDRQKHERAERAWGGERGVLESHVAQLQEELRRCSERMEEMERKQEEVLASGETIAQERSNLLVTMEASDQRVCELEEDIQTLTQMALEREMEVERMKERVKKAAAQRRDEEQESKNLQFKLEQTERELRGLSKEFQGLRSSLAQRDTNALQLQNTITTLTHKLTTAHRKETESEVALNEMRGLRERLSASQRSADGLKGELSSAAAQRDQGQAELHQARLQAAQLTLQLADAGLTLREGRAQWTQERQSLQRTSENDRECLEKLNRELQRMEEKLQEARMEREKVEVELGREQDCHRVQLSETRRELQELKASLRVAQKEKEQLLGEKQELMEYASQLEQRLEAVSDAKWSAATFVPAGRPRTPPSDSEDESPEALRQRPPPPPGPLGHHGLCEQRRPDSQLPAAPSPSPRDQARGQQPVVISQPAPLYSPRQPGADAHSSESEEDPDTAPCGGLGSGEESALLLSETTDSVVRDLADPSLW